MKRFAVLLSSSFYFIFIIGLLLHTSGHPAFFGKYTLKYIFGLILLIILFVPFIRFIFFLSLPSFIASKKGKKIIVSSKLKWVVLLLFFVVFVLAPIEIFLRYKYRNFESHSYTYTIENFHPFLQSQLSTGDGIGVNSYGFREEEILEKKPEGTFRIVLMGGSTVLNREVPFEENAARVLEKLLRAEYPRKKIEVLNAGKDYYTTEHSLIQYMFKVREFNPDIIIMWHGINDLLASCVSKELPIYKSDYSHVLGAVSNIALNYFKPEPIIKIKLVSLDFLLKFMRDNLYSDISNAYRSHIMNKAANLYISNYNTVNVHDFPSINAYKRNLAYLIDVAEKDHVGLILGNQPSLYKPSLTIEEVRNIMFPRNRCMKDNKYYSLNSFLYGINLFNSSTKEIAGTYGVPFIDLDEKIPKNLDYFLDGVHYTRKANRLIAQTFFDYIKEANLIHILR